MIETCGLCGDEIEIDDESRWISTRTGTTGTGYPMPHRHNPELRSIGEIHAPDLTPDAVEATIEERL